MIMDKQLGIYIFTEDGEILGRYDDSRLKSLIWYKKLWAKINKKYREKFIDCKPFEIIDIRTI